MKIVVITAGSGGGHRATARALVAACTAYSWEFTILDYTDILGFPTRWGDHFYNWLMATGRMRWMSWLHTLAQLATRWTRPLTTARFRAYFRSSTPDLVVSCCPVINGVCVDALEGAAPLVTLLSDFESSSDHPWIQDPRQFLICGTQRALDQALAANHPEDACWRVSGMLVHPSVYAPPAEPVLTLPPGRTVCVCFGGVAPPTLRTVVEVLQGMDEPLNIVVVGAHVPASPRVFSVGYTENVAAYMRLADVVVGKPGPGVVSETLVLELPVVVLDHPDHTPPQEHAVADWVREHRVGVVITSLDELPDALAPERLQACVCSRPNMAHIEIPEILKTIASSRPRGGTDSG